MKVNTVYQHVHRVSLLLLLLGLSFSVLPQEGHAQRWLQTAQVITPIQEGPVRALLDTLIQNMERRDGLMVKRSPDHQESMAVSELRNMLLDEEGIGLTSATHVFIDYRFQIANKGFEEYVDGLWFIFRLGADEEDIPIMYIDATEDWAKGIIQNKGTNLATNEAALQPFRQQLAFARIARRGDDTQIVEVGGQTVRNGYDQKKRELVNKVQRLTYESQ